MGLTSTWFAVVLLMAAICAVAAALLLWTKVRGPRPVRAVARVGMILLCQATAICLMMVLVNNRYGFYASWADLLGDANSGGGGTASAADPAVTPAVPDYHAAFRSYSAGFRRATVRGWHSGTKGEVIIWVPPQYAAKEYAHTRFPVIEVLHGIPGTPHSFLRGMRIGRIMAGEIAAGRAEPAILVLPTITPDRVDTGCADVPGRSKVATWLTDDIPQTVAANFRTLPGPGGWAVMGISTGGYCAARLALDYPGRFAAAAALAPDDPAHGARNPLWLARNGRPAAHILVESSFQDRESPPKFGAAIAAAVRPPGTVSTVRLTAGGHNWQTWGRMFPGALTWLSGRLEAPRAVPLAPSTAP